MDNARLQTKMSFSTTAPFASPQVYYLSLTVINDSDITSVTKKPDGLDRFGVYPNPFEHTFKVSYSLTKPSAVGLRLISMLGQTTVTQEPVLKSAGEHSFEVDASKLQLASGMYWVEILIDGKSAREKILHY
jgi:hypothetical protein